MKRFYAILTGLLLFAAALAVFACFDDDPNSKLKNFNASITGGDGSSTDVELPGQEQANPDGYAAVVAVSYPVTLNISFSGFLDGGYPDPHPITRMCLLVYSGGRWIILHDVKNPQYEVVTEADELRALFGRYTIPHPMGTISLFVLFYFENSNGKKSFDLEQVLNAGVDDVYLKKILRQQLKLVNSDNVNPM